MSKHDTAPRPASHTITCDYYGRLATGWSCPRLIELIFEKLESLNFLYQATDILKPKRFVSHSQLNKNITHGNTPMHTFCHRAALWSRRPLRQSPIDQRCEESKDAADAESTPSWAWA